MIKVRFQFAFLILILLISAAVFTAVHFNPMLDSAGDEPTVVVERSSIAITDDNADRRQVSIDILQQRIVQLEAALSSVQKSLASLERKTAYPATDAQSDTFARQSSQLVDADIAQRQGMQQRVQRIEDTFYGEVIDNGWALAVEQTLLQSYIDSDLSGVQLLDNSCRNSACRMEVGYEEEIAKDKLLMQLERRHQMDYEAYDSVDNDGRQRTVIYLIRSGHSRDSRSAASVLAQ